MQLTSIKLSGFKSFVDPTNIQINGQLIGVVGPNGCGKSNIIDAVRWVLGESRASELRGESMKDVIFNGTTQRKPAGRASVELIFDNSNSRISGQWGKYNELAVKRILTRDGGSSYYINNQLVRRRDVQDIFLGTGLGPRAYAIIGQGMISRIIEARPEDLRIFLEEAAGVSKYKERRRETENRLTDTRDNLHRVSDILSELEQSLAKLSTQAQVAHRYQELTEQKNTKQNLLWLLRQKAAQAQQQVLAQKVLRAQTELEALNASKSALNTQLEEHLVVLQAAQDKLNAAQGELYQINSEIGSVEAEIRHVTASKERLNGQITSQAKQKTSWSEQEKKYQDELKQIQERFNVVTDVLTKKENEYETQRQKESSYVQALNEARKTLNALREATSKIKSQVAVVLEKQKSVNQTLERDRKKQAQLQNKQKQIAKPNAQQLEQLKSRLETLSVQLSEQESELKQINQTIPNVESQRKESQNRLFEVRDRCVKEQARLDALKQLQDKTQKSGRLASWLQKQGLSQLIPLYKTITIKAGWELALESVLRERLRSLDVASLDNVRALAQTKIPSRMVFVAQENIAHTAQQMQFTPLVDYVSVKNEHHRFILIEWLSSVFVANSLEEAIKNRSQLPAGGCFVVQAGHCVDRVSVRLYATESDEDGYFVRQQEMIQLAEQLQTQIKERDECDAKFQALDVALKEKRTQSGTCQKKLATLQQSKAECQLLIVKEEERVKQYEQQQKQIAQDLQELAATMQSTAESQATLNTQVIALDKTLKEEQEKEAKTHILEKEKEDALNQFRQQLHETEKANQKFVFEKGALQKRIQDVNEQLKTLNQQIHWAVTNIKNDQLELEGLSDDKARTRLQTLLTARTNQEHMLANLRQNCSDAENHQNQLKESFLKADVALQPQREKITALQLEEQQARINVEQLQEKLEEAGADLSVLETLVSDKIKPATLQAQITQLTSAITELGPVNLGAAIELDEAQKRKTYLTEQYKDLTDAIATLEDAIRRIDRETRALLKETFEKVNTSLEELFPILFGGGHARLTMTGEEILDAGVQIMAQPPGKKNASIQLLSGGEKAMTAIALVFSLFRLNPAPFCLLDEVDAPLDDANTERFSAMVKRMSVQTQFLFISHNRLAMEMAGELVGVTMQEQGVSRIVMVDIDRAAQLAQSGGVS